MASEQEDLEALFDAESMQYRQSLPAAQTPPGDGATASRPEPARVTDNPAGGLEQYYQAVSGLYLQHPPASAPTDDLDHSMYERLGGIVRQLHDSLRELGYDKSLSDAALQIVDTKDRLEYIATLTEQSAVKVLNTLEAGMPAQDALIRQGREMEARWALLFAGKIGIEEFKVLAADARQFAATVTGEAEKEKARLLEIMMAQDFQDLTGQIIKKVVGVTKGIEQDLAKLLLDNAPAQVKEKHVELMSGPSLAGSALEQGDVDDMLADLGF